MSKREKKNTFKFQSFEELIQVEILLKKKTKLDPKEESHLAECFNKWNTLNCSLEFVDLRNLLGPKILTLNLLILNEEEVVSILFKYMEDCTSFSVSAVLDLLQSLVCDIRGDFLPYFERAFILITKLIERADKDSEMILASFSCIAHILSFLERSLINNLSMLFPLIKPLLFHNSKPYIRHFSAQSLAYLLRKSKDFSELFSREILHGLLGEDHSSLTPHQSHAIGKLMCACMKTKDSLFSSTSKLFNDFIDAFNREKNELRSFLIDCFDVMFEELLKRLNPNGFQTVWSLIIDRLFSADIDEDLLVILELFLKHSHPVSLSKSAPSIGKHIKLLIEKNFTAKIAESVSIIIDKLPGSVDMRHEIARAVVLSSEMTIEEKFRFVGKYISDTSLELVIRNSLNSFLSTNINSSWLSSDPNNLHRIILAMTNLVLEKYPISRESSWKDSLSQESVNFNLFILESDCPSLLESIVSIISDEKDDERHEEMFWMMTIVVPHLYPANIDKRLIDGLQKKLKSLLAKELTAPVLLNINTIIECIVQLNSIQKIETEISVDLLNFINLIDEYDFAATLEPVLLDVIYKSISIERHPSKFFHLQDKFLRKLKSPNHKTRLNTLRVLRLILKDETATEILNVCEEIETFFELHEAEFATKERIIFRLLNSLNYDSKMTSLNKQIIVNYLLGILHVQYALLWNGVGNALSSFVKVSSKAVKISNEEQIKNEKILWATIQEQLEYCRKQLRSESESSNSNEFCCALQQQYTVDKFYKQRAADWLIYRLNIIKFLIRIPELSGKKTSFLSPMFLEIFNDEFFTNKNPKKPREDSIISLMNLFSKFPSKAGTHSLDRLKNLYLKCLSNRRAHIQQAAFQVLTSYNIPELTNYKEKIGLILTGEIKELKSVSLSEIHCSHRAVIVPIMMRIVIGKLKSIGQIKKNKPLISYLLDLDQSEIHHLILLLLEGLKLSEDKSEIIRTDEEPQVISGAIRKSIESETTPTSLAQSKFGALQGVCGSLKSLLENLLNKFTNENLKSILLVIMDFYACCSSMKNRTNDDSSIPQLKHLRQECLNMILFYFKKIEEFPWTKELLDSVMELIVRPKMKNLVKENTSSANVVIQLALLWSDREDLVHLINEDIFDSFVQLLGKPKLNRENVGYKLIYIIYNIVSQHATDGKQHSLSFQQMTRKNLPAIIEYLNCRVKNIKLKQLEVESIEGKTDKITEATTTRKELALIGHCVEYITSSSGVDPTNIFDMINCILVFLYKSNKHSSTRTTKSEKGEHIPANEMKEKIEVDFLRALESLMNIVDAERTCIYFERLLGLFSRFRNRASRIVLSRFVNKVWEKLSPHLCFIPSVLSNIGDVAIKLNLWSESRLEEMDCDTISETIQQVQNVLKSNSMKDCLSLHTSTDQQSFNLNPNLWLYSLVCQNCLYILSEVAEIGTRQIALDFIEEVLRSIANCDNERVVYLFFYENMWPIIKQGMLTKIESFRFSFITVVKFVIQNFGKTDRFKDIERLSQCESGESNLSFFDNMLSLTTAINSKGLRQLIKFLSHNTVSTANLKDILLPLVLHRIELISQSYDAKNKSSLTNAQRESLTSSFDALSACAQQLPLKNYQKLLKEYMIKLDKGINVELVIKTIIGMLNGYRSNTDEENHEFMIGILSRLEKHLSKRTANEMRHKKAQKSNVDDVHSKDAEWTLKGMTLQAPIALAMINIGVKLPKKHLKEIVTKVVLRICDFLKAKEVEVRKEAGVTLCKILESLNQEELAKEGNIRYLGFIVSTIRRQLDRGFQRHVGLFTCHRLIQKLVDNKYFDRLNVDEVTVRTMTEMYLDELFGDMAKEKAERSTSEKGIVKEAKNVKAYDGFRLLANIINENNLLALFQKLVDTSKTFRSQTNLKKFQMLFDSLHSKGGLLRNSKLSAHSMFTLAMISISDHLNDLFGVEKQSRQIINTNKRETIEDLHLYKPATRLDGDQVPLAALNTCSSSHLIINCGLNLLYRLCKIHTSSTDIDLRSMVDPLLEYILQILDNVQYKLITFSAIKCLKEVLTLNPPSLKDNIERLKNLLFKIHNKNSINSDTRDILGENVTNVLNKTITHFIQLSDVHLSSSQYSVLLLGVQVDSLNTKRQMTSFNVLRAIIENRIKNPNEAIEKHHILLSEDCRAQLAEIILKVRNISLLSPIERTRSEAQLTMISYWKNFPQTKENLRENVVFLLKQLPSLDESGQLSGCLLIQNIFKQFSPSDFDAEAISDYAMAVILIAMTSKGVTEKVEKVFEVLINQIMNCVDTDKQTGLCNWIMEFFDKYELFDQKFGVSFFLMSQMLTNLQNESRISFSRQLINVIVDKLSPLMKHARKLNEQLAARVGEDADLMTQLEEILPSKKRKLDDNEDERESESENKEEMSKRLETKEQLSEKLTVIMQNINRLMTALSRFLTINDSNETDVSILLYLLESSKSTWNLVVQKLLRCDHSIVRLNCAKNILQQLLQLQSKFEQEKDFVIFKSKESFDKIISSSFNQMKNDHLSPEECDAVLVNILLVWQLILKNVEVEEEKTELIKKIINNANYIANDELLKATSLHKRCAILKFLAGICSRTNANEMECLKIEKNILWMQMREERQAQDESTADNKTSNNRKRHHKSLEGCCTSQQIKEWKDLVSMVGQVVRKAIGEDNSKKLSIKITRERAAEKVKRKIAESALSVSNPGEALRKKIKKSKTSL